MAKSYHSDLFCEGHEPQQVLEECCVYCSECHARGVETVMVEDTDFGGHLCPTCEPGAVALLGSPQRETED